MHCSFSRQNTDNFSDNKNNKTNYVVKYNSIVISLVKWTFNKTLTGGVPLFLSFGLGGTCGGETSISTAAGGGIWFSWASVLAAAAIAFLYLSTYNIKIYKISKVITT